MVTVLTAAAAMVADSGIRADQSVPTGDVQGLPPSVPSGGPGAVVQVSIPPPSPTPFTLVSTLQEDEGLLRLPVSAFDEGFVAHVFQGRLRLLNDSLTRGRVDLYFVQTPHLVPATATAPENESAPHCFATPHPSPDVRLEVACEDGLVHGLLGTWAALANIVTIDLEHPVGVEEGQSAPMVFEDAAVRLFSLDGLPDPLLVFAGGDEDPSRASMRERLGHRFYGIDLGLVEEELALSGNQRLCADFLVPGGGFGGGFTGLGQEGIRATVWLTVPRASKVVHVMSPPGDPLRVRVSTEFAAVSYHDGRRRALFVDNDTDRPVTGRMCMARTSSGTAVASRTEFRIPAVRFYDPFPAESQHTRYDDAQDVLVRPLNAARNTATPMLAPASSTRPEADLATPGHQEKRPARPEETIGPVAEATGATGATPSTEATLAHGGPSNEANQGGKPVRRATEEVAMVPLSEPRAQEGRGSAASSGASRPARRLGPVDAPPPPSTARSGPVEVAYVDLAPKLAADSPRVLADKLEALHAAVKTLKVNEEASQIFRLRLEGLGAAEVKTTVTRVSSHRYGLLVTRREDNGHWVLVDVRSAFGLTGAGKEAEDLERVTGRPVLDAWRVLDALHAAHCPFPSFLVADLTAQLADDLRPLMAEIPRGVMAIGPSGTSRTIQVLGPDNAAPRSLVLLVRYLGLRDYDYFEVRVTTPQGEEVASVETWQPKKDLLRLINRLAGTRFTRADFPRR